MKVALIVPDGFKDLAYLSTVLDGIDCHEIISGTSNGYELLEQYLVASSRDIIISKATASQLKRAYNAIDAADHVVILTHAQGIKTKKAIEYAQRHQKSSTIFQVA